MPGNSGSSKNPIFTHKQHAAYLKKYIYVRITHNTRSILNEE